MSQLGVMDEGKIVSQVAKIVPATFFFGRQTYRIWVFDLPPCPCMILVQIRSSLTLSIQGVLIFENFHYTYKTARIAWTTYVNPNSINMINFDKYSDGRVTKVNVCMFTY